MICTSLMPTGAYSELQGDFIIGGGLAWASDGKSLTINVKPSVGFAAYYGSWESTDSTIAARPSRGRAP